MARRFSPEDYAALSVVPLSGRTPQDDGTSAIPFPVLPSLDSRGLAAELLTNDADDESQIDQIASLFLSLTDNLEELTPSLDAALAVDNPSIVQVVDELRSLYGTLIAVHEQVERLIDLHLELQLIPAGVGLAMSLTTDNPAILRFQTGIKSLLPEVQTKTRKLQERFDKIFTAELFENSELKIRQSYLENELIQLRSTLKRVS